MDVMFGTPLKIILKESAGELEADLESDRLHTETSQVGENFRSLLNTNTSEITAETSRAINSEFSSKCLGGQNRPECACT